MSDLSVPCLISNCPKASFYYWAMQIIDQFIVHFSIISSKCLLFIVVFVTKFQENPNAQPYAQKIPRPTDGAYMRVHQPVFPHIDAVKVTDIIDEGTAKQSMQSK